MFLIGFLVCAFIAGACMYDGPDFLDSHPRTFLNTLRCILFFLAWAGSAVFMLGGFMSCCKI